MLKPTPAVAGLLILILNLPAWAAPPVTIEAPVASTRPAATSQPAGVREDLGQLSEEDRELVNVVMQGLDGFYGVLRETPNTTLAAKIEPMLQMADRLRDRANLAINNLTLCESVERFGVYEPISSNTFTAGKDTPTIVYFEVENFHPRQAQGGIWETKLKYELTVYTDTSPAAAVYSKPVTPVIDRCRARRRDFFVADKITLPKKLTAGTYVLKVTVTDEQAKRVGEAALTLQLASP